MSFFLCFCIFLGNSAKVLILHNLYFLIFKYASHLIDNYANNWFGVHLNDVYHTCPCYWYMKTLHIHHESFVTNNVSRYNTDCLLALLFSGYKISIKAITLIVNILFSFRVNKISIKFCHAITFDAVRSWTWTWQKLHGYFLKKHYSVDYGHCNKLHYFHKGIN